MTKDALRDAVLAVPLERRLAVAIAALGVQKQAVAEAAGIQNTLFSRTLGGYRQPPPDECRAIAKAIGLSVADLFGDEVEAQCA